LQPRLHGLIAHQRFIARSGIGRVNRAPQAGRPVRRDLEAIAPLIRIGEIAARAVAALGLEIEGRRQHDEALGPGEAFEFDATRLAHDAAPAIGADQISAAMDGFFTRTRDRHIDAPCVLHHRGHAMIPHRLDIRQRREPIQDEIRGLELLALDDERLARVLRQERMIEFCHLLAGRPVPELEDGADQPDARHILDQPGLRENFEGRRVGRRGARILLRRRVLVEKANRQASAPQQQRREQPDWAATGDDDAPPLRVHAKPFTDFIFLLPRPTPAPRIRRRWWMGMISLPITL
jgi:hypothetical protein